MMRLILVSCILVTTICFCCLQSLAQPLDTPGKGKITVGVDQKFMNDLDITPKKPVYGWLKGEIDRAKRTSLKINYGVSDNMHISAVLGYMNADIFEVKGESPCDYNRSGSGVSFGTEGKIIYDNWKWFTAWSEAELLWHQFDSDYYMYEWKVTPLLLGIEYAGVIPYLGISYSDFRINDRDYRFGSEELLKLIVGCSYTYRKKFYFNIEVEFSPEWQNTLVGNDNGVDGLSWYAKFNYRF